MASVNRDIAQFSAEEVAAFVINVSDGKFASYAYNFESNGITGAMINVANNMKDGVDTLLSEIGITSKLHRMQLIAEVNNFLGANDENDSARLQHTNEWIRKAVKLWRDDRPAALKQYGHISDWNTSHVTSMTFLFRGDEKFNDDISKWDVGAVTDMSRMFHRASSFNQPIGGWNVSAVTNMHGMFSACRIRNKNKPISLRDDCCVIQ